MYTISFIHSNERLGEVEKVMIYLLIDTSKPVDSQIAGYTQSLSEAVLWGSNDIPVRYYQEVYKIDTRALQELSEGVTEEVVDTLDKEPRMSRSKMTSW